MRWVSGIGDGARREDEEGRGRGGKAYDVLAVELEKTRGEGGERGERRAGSVGEDLTVRGFGRGARGGEVGTRGCVGSAEEVRS